MHGRGVGAQDMWRAVVACGAVGVEGVHFGARGVVSGDVEGVEVIPVALDLRAVLDAKAHVGKDRGDLFGDLGDRVDGAHGAVARGQCDVEPFAAQTRIKGRVGERGFLGAKGRVDLVFESVQGGACGLAFFGRHFAQFAHLQGDFTFLAKGLHAQVFEAGFVAGICNQIEIFGFQIVHVAPHTWG